MDGRDRTPVLARAAGGIVVTEASHPHLASLLAVQHRAFGRVARSFGIDPEVLPPIRESVEDLSRLLSTGMRFFAAWTPEGRIVGGVRGEECGKDVEIGRLVVDDGFERRGIATALMDALECSFPHAERFSLFTGADATEPLALYRARGYAFTRSETVGPVELVWLEKPGPAAKHRNPR